MTCAGAIFSIMPRLSLIVCVLIDTTLAFVVPCASVTSIRASANVDSSSTRIIHAFPLHGSGLIDSGSIDMLVTSPESSFTLLSDGIGDTITTIASIIAILVFGFGALLLIMANIVIPQAAQELETKARKEYPDYWAACEAKLEEGETLAMRPDLIQDLGRQVQEAELAKFEELQKQGGSVVTEETVKETTKNTDTSAEIMDVEVITEKKDDDK